MLSHGVRPEASLFNEKHNSGLAMVKDALLFGDYSYVYHTLRTHDFHF